MQKRRASVLLLTALVTGACLAFASEAGAAPPPNPGNVAPPIVDLRTTAQKNDDFLRHLYLDVLGRAIDPSELTGYGSLLARGAHRDQVAALIIGLPEFGVHAVTQIWSDLMGGGPMPGWLLNAQARLLTNNSATIDATVGLVMGSPDYFTHVGGTNALFVTAMYRDLLGRPPTTKESADATAAFAQGKQRTELAMAIINADEYKARVIDALYMLFFKQRRTATTGTAYLTMFTGGMRRELVMVEFLRSAEYFARR